MWLWLQNMRPQSHKQFWYYIAVSCFIGHLLFLIFSFRYQGQKPLDLTIFASARATEVVFLPAYKKVPGARGKLAQGKIGKQGKNSVKGASRSVGRTAKSVKSSAGIAKQAKPDTYTVPVKANKKLDVKAKSSSASKTQVKDKVAVKQVEPVKTSVVEPAATSPEAPAKDLKQPLKLIESVDAVEEEPILIGIGTEGAVALGREDLVAWQAAQELESVIVQSWRPPTGFGKELVCQVQLSVDQSGHVSSFEIKQGSGVLAYDLSIRQVLPKLIFPETVRNKILIISFKQ